MSDIVKQPIISAASIRIIAVQLLLFGLLFLPEFSIYPMKWEVAEYSLVMRTFQDIVDNPFFYAYLAFISILMLFSFDVNVEEVHVRDGRLSMGQMFVKALTKVITVYGVLYIASWLLLIYKLRFLGDVYINNHLVAAAG